MAMPGLQRIKDKKKKLAKAVKPVTRPTPRGTRGR